MTVHRLRIEKDPETNLTHVFLDDQDLLGVTGLTLRMRYDELASVQIEMNVVPDKVEAVTDVSIRREYVGEALLNQPIEVLGLGVHAYNTVMRGMNRNGKWDDRDENQVVGDVVLAYHNGRLKRYRMMGRKTYEEVCSKLKEKGLI